MRLTDLLFRKTTSLRDAIRRLEDEEVRQSRPFIWFVLLVLLAMYVWVLANDAGLRSPGPAGLLLALLAVHGALHWLSPYLANQRRWLVPYLVTQGALVLAINLAFPGQGILLGLYFAPLGESVSFLARTRWIVAASLGYLALIALNIGLLSGWASLPESLVFVVPMLLFVVLYVTMFMRQTEARRRAQSLLRELESAHRQLADYADQVEALTLANERQRLARELHDTLAQGLAGLILQMEALEVHLARGDTQKAGSIAGQAKERARATLAEARRTITDLRSRPDLSESLPETLRNEAQRFSSATSISCTLDVPASLSLPAPTAEHVSRFVNEGLANVARHARASRATVSLTLSDDALMVGIRDDGVGFEPGTADDRPGHYGLLGLRERARLAGGVVEVNSAPGAGTVLSLRLPIQGGGVPG